MSQQLNSSRQKANHIYNSLSESDKRRLQKVKIKVNGVEREFYVIQKNSDKSFSAFKTNDIERVEKLAQLTIEKNVGKEAELQGKEEDSQLKERFFKQINLVDDIGCHRDTETEQDIVHCHKDAKLEDDGAEEFVSITQYRQDQIDNHFKVNGDDVASEAYAKTMILRLKQLFLEASGHSHKKVKDNENLFKYFIDKRYTFTQIKTAFKEMLDIEGTAQNSWNEITREPDKLFRDQFPLHNENGDIDYNMDIPKDIDTDSDDSISSHSNISRKKKRKLKKKQRKNRKKSYGSDGSEYNRNSRRDIKEWEFTPLPTPLINQNSNWDAPLIDRNSSSDGHTSDTDSYDSSEDESNIVDGRKHNPKGHAEKKPHIRKKDDNYEYDSSTEIDEEEPIQPKKDLKRSSKKRHRIRDMSSDSEDNSLQGPKKGDRSNHSKKNVPPYIRGDDSEDDMLDIPTFPSELETAQKVNKAVKNKSKLHLVPASVGTNSDAELTDDEIDELSDIENNTQQRRMQSQIKPKDILPRQPIQNSAELSDIDDIDMEETELNGKSNRSYVRTGVTAKQFMDEKVFKGLREKDIKSLQDVEKALKPEAHRRSCPDKVVSVDDLLKEKAAAARKLLYRAKTEKNPKFTKDELRTWYIGHILLGNKHIGDLNRIGHFGNEKEFLEQNAIGKNKKTLDRLDKPRREKFIKALLKSYVLGNPVEAVLQLEQPDPNTIKIVMEGEDIDGKHFSIKKIVRSGVVAKQFMDEKVFNGLKDEDIQSLREVKKDLESEASKRKDVSVDDLLKEKAAAAKDLLHRAKTEKNPKFTKDELRTWYIGHILLGNKHIGDLNRIGHFGNEKEFLEQNVVGKNKKTLDRLDKPRREKFIKALLKSYVLGNPVEAVLQLEQPDPNTIKIVMEGEDIDGKHFSIKKIVRSGVVAKQFMDEKVFNGLKDEDIQSLREVKKDLESEASKRKDVSVDDLLKEKAAAAKDLLHRAKTEKNPKFTKDELRTWYIGHILLGNKHIGDLNRIGHFGNEKEFLEQNVVGKNKKTLDRLDKPRREKFIKALLKSYVLGNPVEAVLQLEQPDPNTIKIVMEGEDIDGKHFSIDSFVRSGMAAKKIIDEKVFNGLKDEDIQSLREVRKDLESEALKRSKELGKDVSVDDLLKEKAAAARKLLYRAKTEDNPKFTEDECKTWYIGHILLGNRNIGSQKRIGHFGNEKDFLADNIFGKNKKLLKGLEPSRKEKFIRKMLQSHVLGNATDAADALRDLGPKKVERVPNPKDKRKDGVTAKKLLDEHVINHLSLDDIKSPKGNVVVSRNDFTDKELETMRKDAKKALAEVKGGIHPKKLTDEQLKAWFIIHMLHGEEGVGHFGNEKEVTTKYLKKLAKELDQKEENDDPNSAANVRYRKLVKTLLNHTRLGTPQEVLALVKVPPEEPVKIRPGLTRQEAIAKKEEKRLAEADKQIHRAQKSIEITTQKYNLEERGLAERESEIKGRLLELEQTQSKNVADISEPARAEEPTLDELKKKLEEMEFVIGKYEEKLAHAESHLDTYYEKYEEAKERLEPKLNKQQEKDGYVCLKERIKRSLKKLRADAGDTKTDLIVKKENHLKEVQEKLNKMKKIIKLEAKIKRYRDKCKKFGRRVDKIPKKIEKLKDERLDLETKIKKIESENIASETDDEYNVIAEFCKANKKKKKIESENVVSETDGEYDVIAEFHKANKKKKKIESENIASETDDKYDVIAEFHKANKKKKKIESENVVSETDGEYDAFAEFCKDNPIT